MYIYMYMYIHILIYVYIYIHMYMLILFCQPCVWVHAQQHELLGRNGATCEVRVVAFR